MRTNIIMSFRDFEGEHGMLQDMGLESWVRQHNCRVLVADGGEKGVVDRCEKYGLQRVEGITTGKENGHDTKRFMACDFWNKMRAQMDRDCEYVVYANADIIAMHQGLDALMRHCDRSSREPGYWGAFFRRINIVNWKDFVVEGDFDRTISNFWQEIWEVGTVNQPGMGDVTCWSYRGFEEFAKIQVDVPWNLLGMDRVWLDMHFKLGYAFFELTFALPVVHPYHVFSKFQVPDETYEKIFKRKIWPEIWENKGHKMTGYECGIILMEWFDLGDKKNIKENKNGNDNDNIRKHSGDNVSEHGKSNSVSSDND